MENRISIICMMCILLIASLVLLSCGTRCHKHIQYDNSREHVITEDGVSWYTDKE